MLASIVLSNAYQNANVYNMVKPRFSVPRERLSELIADKFTIYTRTLPDIQILGSLFPPVILLNKSLVDVTPHSISFGGSHKRDIIFSEVMLLARSMMFFINAEKDKHKIDVLLNYTKLHTNFVSIFHKVGIAYVRAWSASNSLYSLALDMMAQEQNQHKESLRVCKKVALVTPDYIARMIALQMRNIKDIHIGREPLLESIMGFQVSGYIPLRLKIFFRLKALEQAGVWKKWRDLIENKKGPIRSNYESDSEEVHKPTMSGNTPVVFVVLVCGHVLSTLFLCCENFCQNVLAWLSKYRWYPNSQINSRKDMIWL